MDYADIIIILYKSNINRYHFFIHYTTKLLTRHIHDTPLPFSKLLTHLQISKILSHNLPEIMPSIEFEKLI
jgi:hypothetical protein